jgi:hypothetical protein
MSLDTQIGLWRISRQTGISPSWPEFEKYVQDSLASGMTREEVTSVLMELGRTRVILSTVAAHGSDKGEIGEVIGVRIGLLPTSELLISVRYDRGGFLKAMHIIRS